MATKAQHAARYERVPGFLRSLREEAGLTQREFAAAIKLSQSWVYKTEAGIRRMDVAEFCDWCLVCKVDPSTAIRRLLIHHE